MRYILKITEDDGGPKFSIICPDNVALYGKSPEEAWEKLITQYTLRRSSRHVHDKNQLKNTDYVDGAEAFGLSIPAVLAQLERMPNAQHCLGYRFRYFQPPTIQEQWKPRENDSGCARSEPYQRGAFIASQTGADGVPTKPKAQKKSARPVATISTGLGDAMQYRHARKILDQTIRVGHSKIQGWGLFAKRHIPQGDMIVEYMGELIRTALCDKREQYYDSVVSPADTHSPRPLAFGC